MIWGYAYFRKPPHICRYIYIYIYPPTPALAKAGAAPGNSLPQAFCRPFQSNCRSYTPQPSVFHGVEALFARRQTLQTLPSNPSAGLSTATLAATRPSPFVFKAVQDCRLPAFKPLKPSRRPFQGNSRQRLQTRGGSSHDQTFPQAFPRRLSQLHAPANASNIFQTLPQAFPRQLSQLHAPAICF